MSSDFYDRLAPFYHLLYGDWDAAVRTQGEALARLLDMRGVGQGEPILDAACGIGTQTLGLLARGYSIVASDLSPGAVARLRQELDKRGLRASVRVDDFRTLQSTADGSCAAVLACDNSLPHLLTDAEILQGCAMRAASYGRAVRWCSRSGTTPPLSAAHLTCACMACTSTARAGVSLQFRCGSGTAIAMTYAFT